MPNRGRLMMLDTAKAIRAAGTLVTLLINPNNDDPTDATPYSVTAADVAPLYSTYTQVPIYAVVEWVATGKLSYDEGGRERNRAASIEGHAEWMPLMIKASAVLLQDGSIMRKIDEELSEGQDTFIIHVVGEERIAQ